MHGESIVTYLFQRGESVLMKKYILMLPFMLMLFLATPVSASAAKLVELKLDRTYTSYDFTRDGKKDTFRIKSKIVYDPSRRVIYDIYVNGKKVLSTGTHRGTKFYFYSKSKTKVYLLESCHGPGGWEDITVHYYKNRKFVYVQGDSTGSVGSLGMGYANYISRLKDDVIYIKSYKKYWNPNGSLQIEGQTLGVFGFEYSYKISDSKVQSASKYGKCIGKHTFIALDNFSTSKSIKNLLVADGPRIKKGNKVTLKKMASLPNGQTAYLINVNGKEGWFLDSVNTRIKLVP